jgi:hypothetical protein
VLAAAVAVVGLLLELLQMRHRGILVARAVLAAQVAVEVAVVVPIAVAQPFAQVVTAAQDALYYIINTV